MTKLDDARQIINEVDKQMAELFERRMFAAKMVAEYKQERGLPIFDGAREKQVIEKNTAYIQNEALRSYYVSFLQHTMDVSKQYQHRLMEGMRVAYSGVPGAFAEIAAKKAFPDATAVAYADFASAYRAVEDGECDCAMLPVENSNNGDVGQVMDLSFFGSLHVNGMYELPVTQNLLTLPTADISTIKEVISHPQALGQCSEYIARHGWKEIQCVNTAVAAKMVAESGRNDIAAIGSADAAERYGLIVLEPHIQADSDNTTRFAIFSKSAKSPSASDSRFVMSFTVNNEAGSLGRAVSVIGKYGFNLRALKSRPTKALSWEYYFFVEGEGNIHSDKGRKMIEELNECCNEVKIIGSFEKETVIK
ncbi:MAG: chorismate mutase [Eubacteriaceae bacterium]|nr:chorismate mutase [Eubacteriaceae bacterium]